ncbi:unnamed protein product [Ostreobium quekettii]|uniref:Uncharacterized protein n=1 Tax=Ostreobium quekettii TaxID=121088 RepID=A0A8S1JFU6_9CHLO|nr:unnamed protein product [Ostreobium quekettii]
MRHGNGEVVRAPCPLALYLAPSPGINPPCLVLGWLGAQDPPLRTSQGRSSGLGSLSSQEVKAISQGYYGYGWEAPQHCLQVDWASRPVADRPILDTPGNAKYLRPAGPLHPVESMYQDKVPRIAGTQYRQRGTLRRLGTQVATAGRGFARNFWVIVAFVAVAAGAFGFEGQRRCSAARRHSTRREAYQDYSSSDDDEPAQVDRRGFTAASFMG